MSTQFQKRPYTPQFSDMATVSVRRLAWALNKPMTHTVDIMVKLLPLVVDKSKVCLVCKDKTKCQGCCFLNLAKPQELEALGTLI